MTYATQDDMIGRFGEEELIRLTDRDNTGAIVPDVLNQALTDADAVIDSRLSVRYMLPLPVVPPMLVKVACDIARYGLYDDLATDQVRQRYDDAIKCLDGIVKGHVNLDLPTADPDTEASLVEIDSVRQVFNGGGF